MPRSFWLECYVLISCFIKGSNSSRYTSNALSVKLTSTEQMKRYISYNRYTRIDLHRTSGPGVSSVYRGFVAGYIMFSTYFYSIFHLLSFTFMRRVCLYIRFFNIILLYKAVFLPDERLILLSMG